MRYYPVFMDLSDKHCLVVGAGEVGRRKIRGLLACNPASLLILEFAQPSRSDTEIMEFHAELCAMPNVTLEFRQFQKSDVVDKTLVFACTGSRTVNAEVADACAEHGISCNIVDDPTSGDFIVPAHFESGDLLVALSTGGHSPALARRIRMELQEWFGNRYTALTTLMGRLRPLVLALGNETRQNTTLFRQLVNSDLVDALEGRDLVKAEAILREILPAELHPHTGELLHELY